MITCIKAARCSGVLAVEADALKLKGQEMVRIEAWIDLLEFEEAAEHQP